jgi:ABC-2 type transport system ATP-binding protein
VELRRRVAYAPGDAGPWLNLSGVETIDLLSRRRGGTADGRGYAQRGARL